MSGQEDHISETALEEAAAWHVRLHSNDASEADFLGFEAWVNNPNHRAAFDRIDLLSAELEASGPTIVKELDTAPAKVLPFRRPEKITTASSQRITRRLWIGGAVAAGLGLLVATPMLRQPALNWTAYQTAAGETRAITLEDGSVVTLNSGSRIKVAFTPKERWVEMADAEATFDVTKNPSRPFLIGARGHEIRVVGTEFNVFNFDDATRVTVRRGIVQVRSKNMAQTMRLPAGQEMTQKGQEPALVHAVDPETAFSWRSGNLCMMTPH